MTFAAQVHAVENHDGALAVWTASGQRERVLVHVDAHHDVWWISDRRHVTIANFIAPALGEGLVRELIWVTPDGSWRPGTPRRELQRQVEAAVRAAGGDPAAVHSAGEVMRARIGARPFTICSLAALPRQPEPVWLDCDVDFMMIPAVAYDHSDRHCERPWIRPRELASALAGLSADLITIAYSVEGGYTPLPWRWLGDELAAIWRGAGAAELDGYGLMHQADALAHEPERAGPLWRRAGAALPGSAAPWFRLAGLEWQRGQFGAAQAYWRETIAREPVYAGGFVTMGWPLLWQGRDQDAGAEFERALGLNPADALAWAGLGELAWRARQQDVAEAHWNRALACNPDTMEAHRGLARRAEQQGDIGAALEHHRHAQRLGLHGHRQLSQLIATNADGQLMDSGHGDSYAAMVRLHAYRREWNAAEACARMALHAGHDRVRLRLHLAAMQLRRHAWRGAATETARAARRLPARLRFQARRWKRQGRRLLGRLTWAGSFCP